MGKYVRVATIQKYLENKVRFAALGEQDPNKMTLDFLNLLINEAETQLELDLMERYDVPLQTTDGKPFDALPQSTVFILRTTAEMASVIRVLETDFGRGTSANAEKYTENLNSRYSKIVTGLMERKSGSYGTWLKPPLAGLALSYQNQADTGFKGRVLHTTTISHHPDYAIQQINSPAENYFNGWLDPLEFGRGNRDGHGG